MVNGARMTSGTRESDDRWLKLRRWGSGAIHLVGAEGLTLTPVTIWGARCEIASSPAVALCRVVLRSDKLIVMQPDQRVSCRTCAALVDSEPS
jgi:hypothetical protein